MRAPDVAPVVRVLWPKVETAENILRKKVMNNKDLNYEIAAANLQEKVTIYNRSTY